MLGHRELIMQDYVEIFKRRFWLIAVSAAVCLAVGVGVSHFIKPRYVSQTLVLVEQQKVPEDYVKPVVEENLGQRLSSMREQILSRSRIEPIIEKFNLFPGGESTMDSRVAMTQNAIGIKPIASASGGMPGFFISFQANDPRTAQEVCTEITSLFVSANLSAREASAEGTTEFLKQQLADSKRNLDEQDAKLAAFEQKNLGRLPGQTLHLGDMSLAMGSPNESTLQALTTQLDAVTQSLGRMQQNETFLQAIIAQQEHELRNTETGGGVSTDQRRLELKKLIALKQELETQYTPDHPDVVAVSRKIADLQAEIAKTPTEAPPAAASTAVSDPPQLMQLKFQLKSLEQSITSSKQEQTGLQQDIRAYEAKIAASPLVEEEYKQITRDHETALEFYNTLLKKMNESSMATALEQRQQGEQFRVMDAANLPDGPSYPNRTYFAAGGLACGIFLGLLITALLEYRDTSLRNERDIWAFTKLPTLAIISHIDDLRQTSSARPPSRWKLFSRASKPLESAGD
jgi:polysaccharide chain length determinant protein (PEP-CTERM system associated)